MASQSLARLSTSWPLPTCARQALAASRVKLPQPLGKVLPDLLGVIHLKTVGHIMLVPNALDKAILVLTKIHLGVAIHKGWPVLGAWEGQVGMGTYLGGGLGCCRPFQGTVLARLLPHRLLGRCCRRVLRWWFWGLCLIISSSSS